MAMYGSPARRRLGRALGRGRLCGGSAPLRRRRRGAVDAHGHGTVPPVPRWPHVQTTGQGLGMFGNTGLFRYYRPSLNSVGSWSHL